LIVEWGGIQRCNKKIHKGIKKNLSYKNVFEKIENLDLDLCFYNVFSSPDHGVISSFEYNGTNGGIVG